jgi:uncharacterized LabA/DUF88 family protein
METNRRLALLIDGDNAQASLLQQMLAEVSKYGTVTIRRVYGDWTEPEMKGWKEALHTNAFQPVQQFRYTQGKNATDSALIIDAMDILYTAGVDGFCLASSDSDYTRLATRIREKNLFVIGIGRKLTPRSLVNACDVFVYTENLSVGPPSDNTEVMPSPDVDQVEAAGIGVQPLNPPTTDVEPVQLVGNEDAANPLGLEDLFRTAFDLAVQEDGWAHLGALGNSLRQLDPGFDPRTYGHKQLSQLVQARTDFIEVRKAKTTSGHAVIYVRMKKKLKR